MVSPMAGTRYVTKYEKYRNVMVSLIAGTRYVTIYEKYWDVMVSPMAVTRYTVSTISDIFPNIFGGSDTNLYIRKHFLIYN